MKSARLVSPFNHTIAFDLFLKHFTEINAMYWAYVPTVGTIEKDTKSNVGGSIKPKDYFVYNKEDAHRLANTFIDWKANYRNFQNLNRCNLLLTLNSCFEIYLRTIASLSFESKPGILLGSKDIIDGVTLLKKEKNYGDYSNANYKFKQHIEHICVGEWSSRLKHYKQYFDRIPSFIETNMDMLERMRKTRNNIAHYFGREKNVYETPIFLKIEEMTRVTHKSLLKYFELVYKVVLSIDEHLKKDYIGSYDMIKYFVFNINERYPKMQITQKAKLFQKEVGKNGRQPVGTDYYKKLMSYYNSIN